MEICRFKFGAWAVDLFRLRPPTGVLSFPDCKILRKVIIYYTE